MEWISYSDTDAEKQIVSPVFHAEVVEEVSAYFCLFYRNVGVAEHKNEKGNR